VRKVNERQVCCFTEERKTSTGMMKCTFRGCAIYAFALPQFVYGLRLLAAPNSRKEIDYSTHQRFAITGENGKRSTNLADSETDITSIAQCPKSEYRIQSY
jgi:hypothetical protein